MHDMPARKATLARTRCDTPSVKATNDGITASGLTIVMRAMKERSATLDSGIAEILSAED
jgi:hypothetical protein